MQPNAEFNPLKYILSLLTHDEAQVLNNATRPSAWTIKYAEKNEATGEDGFRVLDNGELLKSGIEKLSMGYKAQNPIPLVLPLHTMGFITETAYMQLSPEESPIPRARVGDPMYVTQQVDGGYMVCTVNEYLNHKTEPDRLKDASWFVPRHVLGTRNQWLLLHCIRGTFGVSVSVLPEHAGLNFDSYMEKLVGLLADNQIVKEAV